MKAHELLSDCSKWTRGCYSRNRNGTPCASDSPHACQWCAMGAIIKCYPNKDDFAQAVNAAQETAKRLYDENIISLNDTTVSGAYDMVLAVLKEADV